MENNMDEMSMIDPDFEPQSRPRSCTWPLNRPNIGRKSEENDVTMVIEATIEEATSQEQLMAEQAVNLVPNLVSTIKQEHEAFGASQNSFQPEYGGVLIGSPASANLVTDFSSIILSPQQQLAATNTNTINQSLSFTDLTPSSTQSFNHVSQDIKPAVNELPLLSSPSQQLCTSVLNDSSVSTPGVLSKPKTSSRKNAWGNMSYADLITQGIESSPDKRLTLAQIYDWMVKNVAYFKDKGDSNSSAGWKNSIRHNLSLHSKFKRIQNEGTGKSSWWIINHDAKPGKTPRRRSMETSNSKYSRSRSKAVAKQKAELLKKQQHKVAKKDSPPWARSPTSTDGDFDHPLNKSLAADFRPRTSSNASSVSGRISPRHGASYIPQDLEDDGPLISSPLSSSYTPGGSLSDFFLNRGDSFSLVDSFDVSSPADSLHTDLLDSIANMDVMSMPSPMNQGSSMNNLNDDRTNVYLNSVERKTSQESPLYSSPLFNQQMKNPKVTAVQGQSVGNTNRGIISSPNLANLLQQSKSKKSPTPTASRTPNGQDNLDGVSSMRRVRANTMPRLQPQPKYNMMVSSMHRPQSGESLVFSPYGGQQQQQQTDISSAVSPQDVYLSSTFSFNNGQQQQQMINQQQRQQAGMQQQQLSQSQSDNSARLSSMMNQNKTLHELLGHQRVGDVQQINTNQNMPQQVNNPLQQLQMSDLECNMQANNFPQQQQQQQHNMPNQNTLEQQQQQQGDDFSNLVQMNQKFPSDINLDNQDIFDPGQLDIDTMLQEMGSLESFGNEFNSYFPPSNTGFIEPENNLLPSITVNQPKIEEASESAFPYSNNIPLQSVQQQQQMSQQQFDQQQQQQRPGMFNINSCGDNNSRVMRVDNNPHSVSMVMSGPGGSMMIASTGINQYNRPHHALMPQSSVGSVTDYRL